jgi:hypothetical protein
MNLVRSCFAALVLAWVTSPAVAQQAPAANSMSFFVTSVGPAKEAILEGYSAPTGTVRCWRPLPEPAIRRGMPT